MDQTEAEISHLQARIAELEQQLAEKSLTESEAASDTRLPSRLPEGEERYRVLTDWLPLIIWTAQASGLIDYVNQSWLKYSGQTWEEAFNGTLAAIIYPDDLAQCLAEWHNSIQTTQPYQTEYRLRRADGSYRWHLARALPIRDESGQVISWVGSCTDIDDQKRAEARLDLQASVLSQVNDVIIAVDNDFNIIYWNEPAAKLYEVKSSEMIGQPLEKAYQNLWDSPDEEQVVMDTIRNAGHWRGEVAQIKTATGERIYVETSSSSLYDQDGQNRGLLAVMREITRRKINEEAVQLLADASAVLATSLNYRATLGSLAELVVGNLADWCIFDLRDESGKMQRVAQAHVDPLKELLLVDLVEHYPIYDWVDNPMSQVLATGQSQLVSAIDENDLVKNANNQEHAKLWQQLNPRSTLVVPLTVQGQVCGIFSCVSTRTDYYQPWHLSLAQELARRASVSIENSQLFQQTQQALEAQRELDAAKDQFLSIASHELRTPLTVVRGYTQLLQRQNGRKAVSPEAAKEKQLLRNLDQQLMRMNDLINEMLDVVRIQNGRLELHYDKAINLVELVERVIEQQQEPAKVTGHTLQFHQTEAVITGQIDQPRLEQVLNNLINNALKYSAPGKLVSVSIEATDDAGVIFRVCDEGQGIEPEAQPHIFERFYRAPHGGNINVDGLGLGLFISHEIVVQHGGRIWLESTPGEGSTFQVWLPLNPPE